MDDVSSSIDAEVVTTCTCNVCSFLLSYELMESTVRVASRDIVYPLEGWH